MQIYAYSMRKTGLILFLIMTAFPRAHAQGVVSIAGVRAEKNPFFLVRRAAGLNPEFLWDLIDRLNSYDKAANEQALVDLRGLLELRSFQFPPIDYSAALANGLANSLLEGSDSQIQMPSAQSSFVYNLYSNAKAAMPFAKFYNMLRTHNLAFALLNLMNRQDIRFGTTNDQIVDLLTLMNLPDQRIRNVLGRYIFASYTTTRYSSFPPQINKAFERILADEKFVNELIVVHLKFVQNAYTAENEGWKRAIATNSLHDLLLSELAKLPHTSLDMDQLAELISAWSLGQGESDLDITRSLLTVLSMPRLSQDLPTLLSLSRLKKIVAMALYSAQASEDAFRLILKTPNEVFSTFDAYTGYSKAIILAGFVDRNPDLLKVIVEKLADPYVSVDERSTLWRTLTMETGQAIAPQVRQLIAVQSPTARAELLVFNSRLFSAFSSARLTVAEHLAQIRSEAIRRSGANNHFGPSESESHQFLNSAIEEAELPTDIQSYATIANLFRTARTLKNRNFKLQALAISLLNTKRNDEIHKMILTEAVAYIQFATPVFPLPQEVKDHLLDSTQPNLRARFELAHALGTKNAEIQKQIFSLINSPDYILDVVRSLDLSDIRDPDLIKAVRIWLEQHQELRPYLKDSAPDFVKGKLGLPLYARQRRIVHDCQVVLLKPSVSPEPN